MINQTVIDNFISTLDTQLPIDVHFLNAFDDSERYKWNDATFKKLLSEIRKTYEKLGRHDAG